MHEAGIPPAVSSMGISDVLLEEPCKLRLDWGHNHHIYGIRIYIFFQSSQNV